jgi:predicted RNA-binding Zn-ribbon protein involved in translation (DUF1610 family)
MIMNTEKEYSTNEKKVYYCKGNKVIDDARVNKYEDLMHFMVRKFLPALALFEAAMDYDDLINQCRYEVFMALRKFDPELAMTSSLSDPVKNAERVAKKLSNPEWALSQAEKCIVTERLKNYLRRTRFNFNPDTLLGRTVKSFRCPSCGHTKILDKSAIRVNGKVVAPPCPVDGIQLREDQNFRSCSVSLDMILEGINREGDNNLFVDPSPIENVKAEHDRDMLMDLMDKSGPEAAKSTFDSMGDDRKEAIKALLLGDSNTFKLPSFSSGTVREMNDEQ